MTDVELGQVLKVGGDPYHPYSLGALCPKMNGYDRTVHSAGRPLSEV